MSYRGLLDNVRVRVPARTYPVKHKCEGDMPAWLAEKLPLFGTDGEPTYLNSGGRSLIVEEGGQVYRIKGADPKGTITQVVAASGKNIINDTKKSASVAPHPEKMERLLSSQMSRGFPKYSGEKPWNFLTQTNVQNSRRAFDALGEYYDRLGFDVPCRFVGTVEYPYLSLDFGPLYSIVYRLPDAESDLRFEEFERQMRLNLQHASVSDLRSIERDMMKMYESLAAWHAAEARVLADACLVPSPDSFLGQNYVLAHVANGKVGISRVDHTSTVRAAPERAREASRSFNGFMCHFPVTLVHAIEIAEKGILPDRQRFSGYFDMALKFYENMRKEEFPRAFETVIRFHDLDENPPENPEPLDESFMLSVFNRVKGIKIDEEFERRKQARYEMQQRSLAAQGLTTEDLVSLVMFLQNRRQGP